MTVEKAVPNHARNAYNFPMSSTCARTSPWEPHRTPVFSLTLSSPSHSSASDSSLNETIVTNVFGRDPPKPSSQRVLDVGNNLAAKRPNDFSGIVLVEANAARAYLQEREVVSRPAHLQERDVVSRPARKNPPQHYALRRALPAGAPSESQETSTACEINFIDRGCDGAAVEHLVQDGGFEASPTAERKNRSYGQSSGRTFRESESKNQAASSTQETEQFPVRATEAGDGGIRHLEQLGETSGRSHRDVKEVEAVPSSQEMDDRKGAEKESRDWIQEWEVMDSEEIGQGRGKGMPPLSLCSLDGDGDGDGSVGGQLAVGGSAFVATVTYSAANDEDDAAADVWDAVMTAGMAGVVGSQEEDLTAGCDWMSGLTPSFRLGSPRRQTPTLEAGQVADCTKSPGAADDDRWHDGEQSEGAKDLIKNGNPTQEPDSDQVAAAVLSKMHRSKENDTRKGVSRKPLLYRIPAGSARHSGIQMSPSWGGGGSDSAFGWTSPAKHSLPSSPYFHPTPPQKSSLDTSPPPDLEVSTAKQKLAYGDGGPLPPREQKENPRIPNRRKRRIPGLHPKPSPNSLSPRSFQPRFQPTPAYPRPSSPTTPTSPISPISPTSPTSPSHTFSLSLLHSPSPSPSGASGPPLSAANRKRPRSILKQTPSPTQCEECGQLRAQAGRAVKHSRKQSEVATLAADGLLGQVQVLRKLLEAALESSKREDPFVPIELREQVSKALSTAFQEEVKGEEGIRKLVRDSNVFCRMAGPEPKKIVFADEVGGSLCHVREFSSREEGKRS